MGAAAGGAAVAAEAVLEEEKSTESSMRPKGFSTARRPGTGVLGYLLGGSMTCGTPRKLSTSLRRGGVLVDELQEQGQVGLEARASVLDDAVGEVVEPDLDGEVKVLDFRVLLLAEFLVSSTGCG